MCITSFRRIVLRLLCVTCISPTHDSLEAQSPIERAVRAVVDSFFAEVSAERWDAAAARLDLARFEPYFKQQLRNVRSEMRSPDQTPEELMARDSTMPRAVAAWQAARMNAARSSRPFGDYSYEFAGVTTQHELLTLALPDAAARWLAARDRRTQLRESFRRQGCPLAPMPTLAVPKHRILAVVAPDDSTAYAIQANDQFPSSPEYLESDERVLLLRRTGGTWRIEPRRDLLFPANVGLSAECPRVKH